MSCLISFDSTFYFSSTIGVLFSTLILTGMYSLFKKKINTILSKEGTAIATEIIISPELQKSSESLFKQFINQKDILDETSKFAIAVLSDTAIKNKIKDTLIDYIKTEQIKAEVKMFVTSLIIDPLIKKELETMLTDLMKNDEIRKVLADLLTSVLQNEQTKQTIQDFLIDILQNARLKNEVYSTLKGLLKDFTQDPDMNKILVEFISVTLMNALNEPVNERFIKDKVVELLTSNDVMDSVSISLMEVVKREDLKKVIGDSAIETLTAAIKKNYPRSFGLMV